MSLNSEIYTLKSFDMEVAPSADGDEYRLYLPVRTDNVGSQEGRYAVRDDDAAVITGATPISSFQKNRGMDAAEAGEIQERIEEEREGGEGSFVRIATSENPVRAPSGGGIDELEDGYLVMLKKDEYSPRDPLHFAAGNGFPQNIEEIFDPQKVIAREISEEFVYVTETGEGHTFLLPSDREGDEENMYPRSMYALGIGSDVMEVSYRDGEDTVEVYEPPNSSSSRETSSPLSEVTGTFIWEPQRAGTNILKVRQPEFASEDILDGAVNIYDGEGDIEGWNRNIYLIDKESFRDALTAVERGEEEEISLSVYRSELKDGQREFIEDEIVINEYTFRDDYVRSDVEKEEVLGLNEEEGDVFIPTQPLRELLRSMEVYPG